MSFYKFESSDIIDTKIVTYPYFEVGIEGSQNVGSIYLEKKYLDGSLFSRIYQGYSDKEGGFVEAQGPFTSSVTIFDVIAGADNEAVYDSILGLYNDYSIYDAGYTPYVTGALPTAFRVINIPEIYYDRQVATGTFYASDLDKDGNERILHDNGRGGVYSGSLSGTLVGNIFYSEGLVVLKAGGLNDKGDLNEFGNASPTAFKWDANFKGTHTIPVKIFRCRAKAGELNASTNPTYYEILTGSDAPYPNQKQIVMDPPCTYITTVGLYNENYELVAIAKLGQPIRKLLSDDLMFRIKMDF